jgi:hypothetical protein
MMCLSVDVCLSCVVGCDTAQATHHAHWRARRIEYGCPTCWSLFALRQVAPVAEVAVN